MRLFVRLLGYVRRYMLQMASAAIMLALAGTLMAVIVASIKPLVNDVLLAPAQQAVPQAGPDLLAKLRSWIPVSQWRNWLRGRAFVEIPILLVITFFIRGIFLYFGEYLTTKTGVSVIRALRLDLYEAITYQSMRFFRQHPTGLIISRVFSDVQRLQRVSATVLADLVRVSAMVPVMLVVVLLHDWRMSLFVIIVFPLMAYPMMHLGRRLRRASRRAQETMADAANLLTETVMGIKVVQGFVMERTQINRFGAALDRMLRADLKAARAAALSSPVMEQVGAIAAATLFCFAGLNIARGRLNPGDFGVVLGGLGVLFMSIRRLNRVNLEIQQALASVERIFQVLDWDREIKDQPGARVLSSFEREIRFEAVDFAYEGEKVLSGINLRIGAEEMVALVGPSGSGKTTITNLLLRFYDPSAGCITLDGENIQRFTVSSLRASIGLVTQETILFDDTVRNNIAFGSANASRQEVEAAARAVHAHEFIRALPRGYETRLGERGTTLSMGQRQRIAIARALLKDAPILILDEATSALDSQSEYLVQQALDTLLQGRTSLVIAHRLSTVRRSDRILVVDQGRIVEEGNHQALLARGGLYAKLYQIQFHEGTDAAQVTLART
ncbi:MAG: ABC transporter ATP-binding protein [Acidobacteriota bacterium]